MKSLVRRLISLVKAGLEKGLGVHAYRIPRHGWSDVDDIRRHGGAISTIVDVGANVGQSALKFKKVFPAARILCIEPVASTHAELCRNLQSLAGVHCHRIALGREAGRATIHLARNSEMNSLVPSSESMGTEEVEVRRLDDLCAEEGLRQIDLLKVDAEGFDLEVLRGGETLLSAGAVRFILVEVAFHPARKTHVQFGEMHSYLLSLGYGFFGLYEQQLEWASGKRRLRFANACYLHDKWSLPEPNSVKGGAPA